MARRPDLLLSTARPDPRPPTTATRRASAIRRALARLLGADGPRARRLVTGLGALGIAAGGAFAPTPADAEVVGGLGAYVSLTYDDGLHIGYGVETFATVVTSGGATGCVFGTRAGLRPLVQFGFVDSDAPRVTVALQGGSELSTEPRVALLGELGATYRFGERAGPGLHLGVSSSLLYGAAFARAELGLGELSLGLAGRTASPFGPDVGTCIAGRPLRAAGDARPWLGAACAARAAEALDDDAQAWLADARAEAASVPAFRALAAELAAAGAPDALVARALGAAQDELGHAAACGAIAARVGATSVALTLPSVPARAAAADRATWTRLAVESWTDGCLGEGAAAAWTAAASQRARDVSIDGLALAPAAHAIAADEARHSALAWDVLAWACAVGGDDVRHAVWALRDVEPTLGDTELTSRRRAARVGRLERDAMAGVLERHVEASRARLARALEA
jgi:hypothetical protein